MRISKPTFDEEKKLWTSGFRFVAGVDEVGRGCFAGPVVAAAVILPIGFNKTNEINDSKLLSHLKRIKLAKIIKKHAMSFSIAEVSVDVINQIGIGKASQLAFLQAIKLLPLTPEYILIDAFYVDSLDRKNQKAIIHGDGKSISIAAASIIAKVYRDELMQKLHIDFPHYGFSQNKGYGTRKHQDAIKKYGLSTLHRTSFNLTKFL